MKPRVLLVMGVAGAGKSTVGEALARALAARFIEADDLHPARNKAKMERGIPLTDEDRAPWLGRTRAAIEDAVAEGLDVVVACSALKRAYRKVLLGGTGLDADAQVIYLRAEPGLLRQRLERRSGHFVGPELLESQLATLEEPVRAITVDAALPADTIVAELLERFAPKQSPTGGPALRARLRKGLLDQPGVTEQKSKFSGNQAFHVDGKEFAHFHSDSVLDVRVPRAHQKALKDDPRVTFRPRPADWIEFEYATDEDVDTVLRLAREGLDEARDRARAKPGRRGRS